MSRVEHCIRKWFMGYASYMVTKSSLNRTFSLNHYEPPGESMRRRKLKPTNCKTNLLLINHYKNKWKYIDKTRKNGFFSLLLRLYVQTIRKLQKSLSFCPFSQEILTPSSPHTENSQLFIYFLISSMWIFKTTWKRIVK